MYPTHTINKYMRVCMNMYIDASIDRFTCTYMYSCIYVHSDIFMYVQMYVNVHLAHTPSISVFSLSRCAIVTQYILPHHHLLLLVPLPLHVPHRLPPQAPRTPVRECIYVRECVHACVFVFVCVCVCACEYKYIDL